MMKKLLAIVATALACQTANAGYAGPVRITWLHITSDGYALFHVDLANRHGNPGCAEASRFSFEVSSAAGKAMLASLLAAYHAGIRIWVNGSGACVYGGEGIQSFTTYDAP